MYGNNKYPEDIYEEYLILSNKFEQNNITELELNRLCDLECYFNEEYN